LLGTTRRTPSTLPVRPSRPGRLALLNFVRIRAMNTHTTIIATWALALFLVLGLLGGGCASTPAPKATLNESYAFWPPPPAEPRIQFLRSFAVSTDLGAQRQRAVDRAIFGAESQQAIDILKPYGVAMRNGRIYVCDTRNARVTVLDIPKGQTRLMGTTGPMALKAPIDVTIASDGFIYVADRDDRVVVYTPDERPVLVHNVPEMRPAALAIHGDQLYIANLGGQNILVLNRRTGQLLETIGTVGDEDGQFRVPLGIATDSQGNLHVVDFMRCRLQKFAAGDRRLLAAAGEPTTVAGNFVRPKHIAADREGLVYVVDAMFENVQVFDVEGSDYRLLTSFGGPGWHPGAMNLPAGIFVTHEGLEHFKDDIHPYFQADRLIVITNQFGTRKVAVYALGQLREGKTLADIQPHMADLFPQTMDPSELEGFEQTEPDDELQGGKAATEGAQEGR
jgi:sugar lactone lactonase YvrE